MAKPSKTGSKLQRCARSSLFSGSLTHVVATGELHLRVQEHNVVVDLVLVMQLALRFAVWRNADNKAGLKLRHVRDLGEPGIAYRFPPLIVALGWRVCCGLHMHMIMSKSSTRKAVYTHVITMQNQYLLPTPPSDTTCCLLTVRKMT